ncbi:MAG: ATP-binding protein, partial [Prolixibacteraceae bacterium]
NESLIRTIPFGINIVDEEGNILFISENLRTTFDGSDIGKKCWSLYKDNKEQCTGCPLHKGITIGETEYYVTDDVMGGKTYQISHTGMMFQGKLSMLEIFQDITDRKKSELKIKTLGAVVEQSPSMTVITDQNGKIEYINSVFNTFMQYSLADIVGKDPWIFNLKRHTPESYKAMWDSLRQGDVWKTEFQNRKKDGTPYWEEVTAFALKDDHGNICNYIIITNDNTERKRLLDELILAKEHAEESDRLKSAFLCNMSHEIRTPMNGILGFADLLKEQELSGEQKASYIEIIKKSGARMLNVINDIIEISKIEAGLVKVNTEESNISEQLEFIYSFFKLEVEAKGMKIVLRNMLSFRDSHLMTDREKLYAILTNLVKNAIKFTRMGSIELGCARKGDFIEFYLRDTGVGILFEQQQLIFERFRQASESLAREYEGAGLGLAISKEYVEMLGGRIWLESELGRGSVFYFTLPYIKSKVVDAILPDVTSHLSNDHFVNDLLVLIAEDDSISDRLLCELIQPFCFKILEAKTGYEAVEACKNNPDIDLILMDILMPEMNGYDAIREIRKFNKDVIIIAQTAYGLLGDRRKAMEAGSNDYIPKPISKDELMTILKMHLKTSI